MNDEPLHEIVARLFERISADARGRDALRMYDHVLTFDVLDGDAFHVEIKDGRAEVRHGPAAPRPITEAHEIKATGAVFRDFFTGRIRFSDAVHEGLMFPMAAHTAKRHIDHWLVRLVNIGLGIPSLKELY